MFATGRRGEVETVTNDTVCVVLGTVVSVAVAVSVAAAVTIATVTFAPAAITTSLPWSQLQPQP